MKKLFIILLIAVLFLFSGCDKAEMPPYGAAIRDGVGMFVFNGNISSTHLPAALVYFSEHNVKRVVFEVHSSGGRLYEVQRILSLLEDYGDAIEYETRVYGNAGSGGLMVFLAGDKRLISRHATFFWHNLNSAQPDDIDKFFDDRTNGYIASRTSLSIDQVREKVKENKDWYFGAKEAIALGIAHGYIE